MEDRSQVAAIIEELKRLDGQIDSVPDLVALKPIFYRIEEINKEHPTDFEVQLLISDVKQHLVNRGTLLKQQPGGAARTVSGTAAVPAQQAGVATKSDPSIWAATASTPAVPSSVPEPPLGAGAPPFPPVTPHVGEKPSGEREVYIPPARTQPPPPQPAAPAMNWKKPVWIGVSVGLILGLAVLGTLIVKKRPKPESPKRVTLVPLEITTIPAGATIRVDGQTCTSNCKVDLKPGQYKLMAELPGYLQDFRDITAAAGQPIVLNLTLAPQPQGLRIITDFGTHGQVLLDDKPAGALQDGQLTLDSVPAGKHSIRVTGRPGQEAKFDFEVKPGAAAIMDGPVTAKNVVAVVANRFGKQIHLQANQNPLKVSLDGAAKGETTADGIDIGDVPEGDRELTLNDGKTPDRKLVVPASASPVMAFWVNADTSTGTLVVNTGEDGVTVLIDGKPQSRKTRRGQLVITSLQPKDYKIKVTKAGFQDVPEQTAAIKGGTQTPLNFTLKAVPTVAVLHVKGGTAGADVYVDKEHVGIIENDGSFQYPNVAPGEHTIEIKKDGFMAKTNRMLFAEGQIMELTGEMVTLQPASGSVKITVAPENAQITVKYPDGRTQRMQAGTHPLPVGSYTIAAAASGFKEASKNVQVNSGEIAAVDLRLTRESGPAPKPPASKAGWERPEDWKEESGWMVHRGAGFVPFGAQPSTGVYTFSARVLKGGLLGGKRVQWYLGYVDNKNYTQCQIEKKSFQCTVVTNGKRANKPKKELDTDETFTVQIDIGPDSVTHRLREGDRWITLDTLNVPNVGAGKFGFYIPGNDGLAISNFTYAAK